MRIQIFILEFKGLTRKRCTHVQAKGARKEEGGNTVCHQDIAVLNQFCAQVITFWVNHTQK